MTDTTTREALERDVTDGLWCTQPTLPPRWFYDERGSRLFDEITRLPEYYPTRRETEILREHNTEIASMTGATTLVELGAGMSTKTRLLLDAFTAAAASDAAPEPVRFVPLDVSAEVLHEAADTLRGHYPGVDIDPVVSDFHDDLHGLGGTPGRRLVVFLGGTIGNFTASERATFLRRIRRALAPGDHFLVGADLVKDAGRLVAAYDDTAGVTGRFNLNVIDVLRSTLGAVGLHPDDFEHVAHWDAHHERIEMHLRARRAVTAWFPTLARHWHLARGATLLTEISQKFRLDGLCDELAAARLAPQHSWTDRAGDFSLSLARAC